LASQLMDEATARYAFEPGQLTLHQDRGSPMIAHSFLDLMGELGVTPSHSRPRVSNDNPFSESQFKTQKSQPDYPARFRGTEHAKTWCTEYFRWYNFEHHHSGLAGFTPEQVFSGRHLQVATAKQNALDVMYHPKPERFVRGRPIVPMPPAEVTINPITAEQIDAGHANCVNFPTLTAARQKSELILN
jgi:putative transposase